MTGKELNQQQQQQLKFAVIVPGASLGHLAPVLPLIQQLTKNNHIVRFYVYKRHADKIHIGDPAQVIEIPTSFDMMWRLLKYEKWQQSKFGRIFRLKQITTSDFTWYTFLFSFQFRQLQAELHPVKWQIFRDVKQFGPDVILYDAMEAWTGEVSENICYQNPHTRSVQVYGLPIQDIKSNYKQASRLKKFSIKVMHFCIKCALLYARLRYNQQKASQGMTYLQGQERGEYNILGVPTQFQPDIQRYPNGRFKYYGYMQNKPEYSFDNFPYNQLKQGKTIYVSLGSVSVHESRLFQIIKETLSQDYYKDYVIVATVPQETKEELGDWPSNFILREFAPQLKVLPYCCLAISHCGINTILECLATDVPIIGIPQRGVADREDNAKIVQSLNCGLYELSQTLSVDKLDKLTKTVLENQEYQENVKKFRVEMLEGGGGVQRAVKDLENLAQGEQVIV